MNSRWLPMAIIVSVGFLTTHLPCATASDLSLRHYQKAEASVGNRLRVCPLPPRLRQEGFLETLADLNSRAQERTEPSAESEQRYVKAIRSWLDSLDPERRERARQIMREAHSGLHELREAIRFKKQELASISFNRGMNPETLPRLGMELQSLRADLGQQLRKISERLKNEAGIDLDGSDSPSFWFVPPPANVH